jgi:hypothetical protein
MRVSHVACSSSLYDTCPYNCLSGTSNPPGIQRLLNMTLWGPTAPIGATGASKMSKELLVVCVSALGLSNVDVLATSLILSHCPLLPKVHGPVPSPDQQH